MRKYNKARKSSRKPRKTYRRKGYKVNSIKRLVKSEIAKNIEDKQCFYSSPITANSLLTYGSQIGTSNYQRLIPNISQGVGENERVGEQITFKGMSIKGYVRLLPATSTNIYNMSQVAVRLMVLSLKIAPSYDQFQSNLANSLQNLLRKGGTTTAFTGYVNDLYAPLNTDLWTKHYNKVMYLSQPVIQDLGAGSQPVWVSNDQRKCIRFFNIKLRNKNKVLKYSSGINSDLQPTNYCPIIFIGYSYLDGNVDFTSKQVQLAFDNTMYYQDA